MADKLLPENEDGDAGIADFPSGCLDIEYLSPVGAAMCQAGCQPVALSDHVFYPVVKIGEGAPYRLGMADKPVMARRIAAE